MIDKEFGGGVLVRRGRSEVGVAPGRVWCDVKAFDVALSTGDHAAALSLYEGEFMSAFHIRGAPAFERWLDDQRQRLYRAAGDAVWRLAERADQDGKPADAARWARRAAAMSMDDELVAQRAIRLLDRLGDRRGAVEIFERLSRHLEELEARPAPETQRLVADIKARVEPIARSELPAPENEYGTPGEHVLLAPLAPNPTQEDHRTTDVLDSGQAASAVGEPAGSSPRFSRHLRIARAFLLLGILIASMGADVWHVRPFRFEPNVYAGIQPRPLIIVSQFAGLGPDPEPQYLGPAITTTIADRLAAVSAVDVVAEDVSPIEARSAGWPVATSTLRDIFLVRGDVLSTDSRIRVRVQLIDGHTGTIMHSAAFDRAIGDIFAVLDRAAEEVAVFLRSELGAEIRLREWRTRAKSVRAWGLLQQAEVLRKRADTLQHNGTPEAALVELKNADSLLVLAEAEDPTWSDLPVSRGRVARDMAWSAFVPPLNDTLHANKLFNDGIEHATRALRRDPGNAVAFELRGQLRHWLSLMAPPNKGEAASLLKESANDLQSAVSIDPGRPRAWSLLGSYFEATGDYAKAYSAAQRAYSADAYLEAPTEILVRLALTAYEIGSDSTAWEWCSAVDAKTSPGAYCRLTLLAWTEEHQQGVDPWEIVEEVPMETPLEQSVRPHLEMLVATVLAKRNLPDSASVVITRARQRNPDDELRDLEAGARVALGEPDSAVALLRSYVGEDPAHRTGVAMSRRFRSLKIHLHDR